MPRLVISTVGTSLLTQCIDRKNPDESNWFTLLLKDSNLKYTRYEGGRVNHIDHFRVNNDKGWRASCIAEQGIVRMRHFGKHDYVNDNP